MTQYNKHGVKNKDGIVLTPQAVAELKDKAKFMYLKERISLRRIAAQLHVTAQTVGNWKKKHGWDLVAKKAEKVKENILLKDLTGQVKVTALVDKEYVIMGLRGIAENGVTESNRVAAFKALGESLGMFDTKAPNAEHEAPLIIEPPKVEAKPAPEDKSGAQEVQTTPPSVGSS